MKSTCNGSEKHYVKLFAFSLQSVTSTWYFVYAVSSSSQISFSFSHTHKYMHFFQVVTTQLSYFSLDITSYRKMTLIQVYYSMLFLAPIIASYTPITTHITRFGDLLFVSHSYILFDDKQCESTDNIYYTPSPVPTPWRVFNKCLWNKWFKERALKEWLAVYNEVYLIGGHI